MRFNNTGDLVIEAASDDLGEAFLSTLADECHAYIDNFNSVGRFRFDVLSNADRSTVASSDDIFDTEEDARAYLGQWMRDVQIRT